MDGTHRLVAQLPYGTGMRVTESLRLRIKDVDFDHGDFVVQEAKGGKDRVVMLPALGAGARALAARPRGVPGVQMQQPLADEV